MMQRLNGDGFGYPPTAYNSTQIHAYQVQDPGFQSFSSQNFLTQTPELRPGFPNFGNRQQYHHDPIRAPGPGLLPSRNLRPGGAIRPQSIPPLPPPPMPPIFLWEGVPVRPPASITELRIEDPSLPIVLPQTEKIDLIAMTKILQKEQDEANLSTIPNLTKQGVINGHWPRELKEMFQPLFCKLCSLNLSSPVVAMDHYKGKRHKSSVEMWLTDRRLEKRATPRPLGPPGTKRKLDEFQNNPGSSFTNKRFPLGKPPLAPPKKLRKDGTLHSAPFAFCELCDVALSSKQTADQHYAGKPHKKRLLESRKTGNFDDVDRNFGIGNAFRVAENGSVQHSQF